MMPVDPVKHHLQKKNYLYKKKLNKIHKMDYMLYANGIESNFWQKSYNIPFDREYVKRPNDQKAECQKAELFIG